MTWCSNTLVQTVLVATSWPITNTCPTFVITWCSNSLVQTAGGHIMTNHKHLPNLCDYMMQQPTCTDCAGGPIMTRQVTNTCPDPCDYSQPRGYDAKLTSLFVQTVLAAATSWQVINTCLTFVIAGMMWLPAQSVQDAMMQNSQSWWRLWLDKQDVMAWIRNCFNNFRIIQLTINVS